MSFKLKLQTLNDHFLSHPMSPKFLLKTLTLSLVGSPSMKMDHFWKTLSPSGDCQKVTFMKRNTKLVESMPPGVRDETDRRCQGPSAPVVPSSGWASPKSGELCKMKSGDSGSLGQVCSPVNQSIHESCKVRCCPA